MIDIGVNLLHPQFAEDRDAVIARAAACGVEQMLITATDINSTRAAIQFCESNQLFCTAGIHPHDAATADADFASTLAELASHPAVRAIGETGLDFNRNYSPPTDQRRVFETQIELAKRLHKPLFVHDRDSDGEVFELLSRADAGSAGVVIHCFTGNRQDLQRYLEAGFYIGITGWVCDQRRGRELQALLPEIPLDRLLLETDAPFLIPPRIPPAVIDWPSEGVSRKHKRRNEPALLPVVAEAVANLLKISRTELSTRTTTNARLLFDIPEPA
jgi:TatD DNase family protein